MASTLVGGYGYDVRDFTKLVRDLRLAQPNVARNLRRQLRVAGEIVKVEAHARASAHSTSIPPTIKVRTLGARVEIRAGGPGVPIAKLYELGDKGGSSSTFRHPVYGNRDVWVDQPRYPFLAAAATAKKAEANVAIRKVFSDLTRDITGGLHG